MTRVTTPIMPKISDPALQQRLIARAAELSDTPEICAHASCNLTENERFTCDSQLCPTRRQAHAAARKEARHG